MNDPVIERIVAQLREQGCHTVILYGSRARGDWTERSDYDVAGFRAGDEASRDARWDGEVYLDLFVYPDARLAEPDQEMLKLRGGTVLHDAEGRAQSFMDALNAFFAAGPEQLPEYERSARRAWAVKMVQRARQGDAEGDYRRHWLLMALLEDYFALRGEWYLGPKWALAWLREHRAPVYALFREGLAPAASLEQIAALAACVVEQESA